MKRLTESIKARLPVYLHYLKSLPSDDKTTISSASIAEGLGLGEVQVRKDLARVSGAGKPKIGFKVNDLINDISEFLGYDNNNDRNNNDRSSNDRGSCDRRSCIRAWSADCKLCMSVRW